MPSLKDIAKGVGLMGAGGAGGATLGGAAGLGLGTLGGGVAGYYAGKRKDQQTPFHGGHLRYAHGRGRQLGRAEVVQALRRRMARKGRNAGKVKTSADNSRRKNIGTAAGALAGGAAGGTAGSALGGTAGLLGGAGLGAAGAALTGGGWPLPKGTTPEARQIVQAIRRGRMGRIAGAAGAAGGLLGAMGGATGGALTGAVGGGATGRFVAGRTGRKEKRAFIVPGAIGGTTGLITAPQDRKMEGAAGGALGGVGGAMAGGVGGGLAGGLAGGALGGTAGAGLGALAGGAGAYQASHNPRLAALGALAGGASGALSGAGLGASLVGVPAALAGQLGGAALGGYAGQRIINRHHQPKRKSSKSKVRVGKGQKVEISVKKASISDNALLAAASVLEMRKSAHVNLHIPDYIRGY